MADGRSRACPRAVDGLGRVTSAPPGLAVGRLTPRGGGTATRSTGGVHSLDPILVRRDGDDLMVASCAELSVLVPVVVDWMDECGYSPSTCAITAETLVRFTAFAAAHGVEQLDGVTPELAAGFVSAVNTDGSVPAVPTMHQRRAVLRVFFRVLRTLDTTVTDPTWGLALPSRTTDACRPLTDAELDVLRAVSLSRVGETRSPSIVALAEAGAVTTEIAQTTTSNINLEAGTVALGPSLHARARVVSLTDWGATQLGRRLRHLDGGDVAVCYGGAGRRHAGQASMSTMLRRLFTRAGLSAEPDLGLGSVRAWAGRRAFDETGRIEDAARLLGCRSLDTAARLIAHDWDPDP